MTKTLLKVEKVSKKFKNTPVLFRNINFSINSGDLILIQGPNGCGKSTLLKICSQLLRPDQGLVYQAKIDVGFCLDRLATLPQTANQLCQSLLKLQPQRLKSNQVYLTYLIKLFRLETQMDQSIKNLSKGTRQKINLVQALMFKPRLLILDEPLEGLDQAAQIALKTQLSLFKQRQAAILITAHQAELFSDLVTQCFKLTDQNLLSVDIEKAKIGKIVQLRFDRTINSKSLDPVFKQSLSLLEDSTSFMIQTTDSKSDAIIKIMLRHNYHLGAMTYV